VLLSLCKEAKEQFGGQDSISPLWVFDSEFSGAKIEPKIEPKIVELDGVAIDYERQTAREQGKYEFEAIDTGAAFTLRLLLTIRKNDGEKDYETHLKMILGALKSGNVAFGAKTKRGFGRVSCACIVKREFVLAAGSRDALNDWLSFLEYDEKTESDGWTRSEGWEKADAVNFSSEYATLEAKLKLDGSIMIRDMRNIYDDLEDGEEDGEDAPDCKHPEAPASAQSKRMEDGEKDGEKGDKKGGEEAGENVPDYKHISSNKKPVILGTSWAGAFRSGLCRLLKQKFPEEIETYINAVFGKVTEAEDGKEATATVSQVIFGASFLESLAPADNNESGYRNITRVKIDRFTGGAASGALFSEKPWFGGETTLEIRYKKDRDDVKELLLLGLDSIDKGILQIGGESAIGRGFFKVGGVTIDGAETEIDQPKHELCKAIRKAGELA
jgi:CRISPR/Cas system CSM-associated protein Csm3 (group 7 of RAMP superfamily)